MDSKKRHTQNLQKLYFELLEGTKDKDEKMLLELFSLYIASNPDFKYNTTYLTDSIQTFFEDQEIFREKREIFYKIIDYLKSRVRDKYNIDITFDAFFKYNTLDNKKLCVTNENDSMNLPNQLGNKKIIMKLTLIGPDKIEYLYEIVKNCSDKEWENRIDSFISIIGKKR